MEGIGQVGALTTLANGAIAAGTQAALSQLGRTAGSQSATIDFEGPSFNAATTIVTAGEFERPEERRIDGVLADDFENS